MRINKPIDIDLKSIFKEDLLNREPVIKDLSELILKTESNFVLSVNAEWGAGKTTFIKLWQSYLETEQNINSIYFSAWEDDFSKEPLIAILGEFQHFLENNESKNSKQIKKKFTKLMKKMTPVMIKITTDAVGSVVPCVGEIAGKSVARFVEHYIEHKSTLQELKEVITKILKMINEDETETETEKQKPFVFFIDELDRCRPLYAIELLERVKHIFNIDNLIFVLAMDKENLSKSIKSAYGDIDTDNYLRRFINLEYNLKNPNINSFCTALNEKFQLTSIAIEEPGTFRSDDLFLPILKELANKLNFSLRQIEHIFTKLHIIFTTSSKFLHASISNSFLSIFVISTIFEVIKSYDNTLYDQFINGDAEAKTKVKDLINQTENEGIIQICNLIIDITATNNSQRTELFKKHGSIIDLYRDDNSDWKVHGNEYLTEKRQEDKKKYDQAIQYIVLLTDIWEKPQNEDNLKRDPHYINTLTTTDSFYNYITSIIKKIDFAGHFNNTN